MTVAVRRRGADSPSSETVKVALDVLARKLRAELMIGLLEPLVAGKRTGRSTLAEFRLVEQVITGERPGVSIGVDPVARPAAAPEWERLRREGRESGQPVAEWEIFRGLHKLAQAQASRGRHRAEQPDRVDVEAVEAAMELPGGLGEKWSLHAYLDDVRARFGADFQPAPPEQVAATLLRVDTSRQLLKPGGFIMGLRPGPDGPSSVIDAPTMQRTVTEVQQKLADRMTAAAGVELLRNGGDNRGRTPAGRDVDQALAAGAAIVRAREARAIAGRAHDRARQLRSTRLGSKNAALFEAGMTTGLGTMSAVALFDTVRSQMLAVVGLAVTTMSAAANTIKDWSPSAEAVIAPFRAWMAGKVADVAERVATRETQLSERASQAPAAWTRALTENTGTALERAMRSLDTSRPRSPTAGNHAAGAGTTSPPPEATHPAARAGITYSRGPDRGGQATPMPASTRHAARADTARLRPRPRPPLAVSPQHDGRRMR